MCRHRETNDGESGHEREFSEPKSGRRRDTHRVPRFWRHGVIGGCLALAWLLIRSGAKPSRVQYPCQQAALGLAAATVGAPTAAMILGARTFVGRIVGRAARGVVSAGAVLVIAALTITHGGLGLVGQPQGSNSTVAVAPAGYRPDVFLVNNARGISPGRYGGVDDLVSLMGLHGLKWHRSAAEGRTFGATGLIARDSVVLVKVNAQWSQRGGTNTDILRGVIRRVVEHPDGFVGEVVVADNGQASGNLDRAECNAESTHQSPQDVVNDFASESWTVSTRLWDVLSSTSVEEFADGDYVDGYVVNPVRDAETGVRVSYPKFCTAAGTWVSYKHGVWSDSTGSYDRAKLVVINLPVLKTHSIYGVTGAVKNHMGVVTRFLSTDAHAGVGRGGLGSVLAEVRMPDITILDCTWILARPGEGPSAPYIRASRRDQLAASLDPVALDVWSVKHVLMPQIVANGYGPAQYAGWQDPDNADSVFRRYLDRSLNEMLLAGIPATNDSSSVELRVWAGDAERDGDVDLADFASFGSCLVGPDFPTETNCRVFDFDLDGVIDLRDVRGFQTGVTGG